jgi:hypothetical protein
MLLEDAESILDFLMLLGDGGSILDYLVLWELGDHC